MFKDSNTSEHFFCLSFREEKRGEKEEEEIAPFAFRKKTALLKEASSQRGKRRGHDDILYNDATLPEGRLCGRRNEERERRKDVLAFCPRVVVVGKGDIVVVVDDDFFFRSSKATRRFRRPVESSVSACACIIGVVECFDNPIERAR